MPFIMNVASVVSFSSVGCEVFIFTTDLMILFMNVTYNRIFDCKGSIFVSLLN